MHIFMHVNTPNTDMAKKINTRPKGLVQDHLLQMRVNKAFLKLIDDWRREQEDLPGRTEAVRRLIESALKKGSK